MAYLATISHSHWFIRDMASSFVGYKTKNFSVLLAPGGTTEVNFQEHGVPEGSRIIRLIYTPNGPGLHPIELHSNEVPLRRGRGKFFLFGKSPYAPADALNQRPIKVSVYVVFTEIAADE